MPRIELLLYEHDVPSRLIIGGSGKASLLLNVFRGLEQQGQVGLLLRIIEAGLQLLPEANRVELERALIQDGYVSTGQLLVPDETRATEHRSALEVLIYRHSDKLQCETLIHHLGEAEEQFRLEKWDSSIGQARKFVEQLLSDIASATAKARGEKVDLEKPVRVRDYLNTCGFFDDSERKKLVDGIYGYLSDHGAHPGISNQSAARFCLSMLWTFGFYVLEKFDAWHNQGYKSNESVT